MEETIKAGIGGYAFTMDKAAYRLLEAYLDKLKIHFKNKSEGSEIINDIEGRMSELLLLKGNPVTYIITLADAEEIISIMGKPSDISEEESISEESDATVHQKDIFQRGKRLYRDMDRYVLGGVLSGLGQYFRVDPVLLRIVYIVALLATSSFSTKISSLLFLTYFVLWFVIPKAETFTQKLAMSGQNPSIDRMTVGNYRPKEMRGSNAGKIIGQILKIFGAIILFLFAFVFLMSSFGVLFFPDSLGVPTIKDFLETNGLYRTDVIVASFLVWFIPIFMIIYFGIRLITKFTVRDLLILGIAFLGFIISCFYIGTYATQFVRDHSHEANITEKVFSDSNSDTLYVSLGQQYKYSDPIFDSRHIYLLDDDEPKTWFLVPTVRVYKDNRFDKIEVEVKKSAFGRSYSGAEQKAKDSQVKVMQQSSSLIIEPNLYNKNNLWNREYFEIIITCPLDKTIILDSRLKEASRLYEKTETEEENQPEKVVADQQNDSTIIVTDTIK